MSTRPFLLDTSVLLHWIRDGAVAQTLEAHYHLEAAPFRPLICVVSIGEMMAFSRHLAWGQTKRNRLSDLTKKLVVVDLSDPRVQYAYADVSTLARQRGWGLFHAKNDLWIAASAKVTDSRLLTFDRDFLPLRSETGWSIDVLDPKSGSPLP